MEGRRRTLLSKSCKMKNETNAQNGLLAAGGQGLKCCNGALQGEAGGGEENVQLPMKAYGACIR